MAREATNENKPEITSKTPSRNTKYHILLIYPPSYTQQHNSCPMGMQMIAAVLENAGYKVSLLDANAVKKRRSIKDIVQIAHQLQPDIIGITLLTPIIKEAYTLITQLKTITNAKIIAGGPHATILPEEAIQHGFDAVVLGEGEVTIVEAVKALLGQMPKDDVAGWVYKDEKGLPIYTKGRPFITNLDTLPLPARHLVNPSDYGQKFYHHLNRNIFSSRGCPARCAFCSGGLFGKKFRFRSAQNIIDEMISLYKTHHTTHFCFVDDAMMVDKKRVKEICDKLIEYNLPITWSVMTRIDTINEEILTLLQRAKCTEIQLGVESGDPETLKKIHKPHTVEMVQKVIPMIAKYKIKPVVFFIFGFPWDDLKSMEKTSRLMQELAPYVEFHPAVASILIPFPGTEIYEKYKHDHYFENWWLKDDKTHSSIASSKRPYFDTKLFTTGNVLDFDFFHYPPEIKQKILDLFLFMYLHNNKKYFLPFRYILLTSVHLSKKLHTLSPQLEYAFFSPLKMFEHHIKNRIT